LDTRPRVRRWDARRTGVLASENEHKDLRTTMIYTHVLRRGGLGVRSPADSL